VPRQRTATFLAEPGQHVEHTDRQKLLENFGHHQDAEQGVLGSL
jgi:hypothetical protein